MPVVVVSPTGTTLQDWIHETRRHLMSFHKEERHALTGAYTAGDATLQFSVSTPLGQLRAGAYVEVDSELFYVTDAAQGTGVVTVLSAQEGTTNVSHASGTVCRVNPRFPTFAIKEALNHTLNALSSPLFAVTTATLSYDPQVLTYDLGDSTLMGILDIRYTAQGSQLLPVHIRNFEFDDAADTTLFPSGVSVTVWEGAALLTGGSLRVTYKKQLTRLANLSDDVGLTGLQITALDLPPMGAAIHLMGGRSIKRSFTEMQPDTRRATEVPAGAIEASTGPLRKQYADRLQDETYQLLSTWPPRREMRGVRRLYGVKNRW